MKDKSPDPSQRELNVDKSQKSANSFSDIIKNDSDSNFGKD